MLKIYTPKQWFSIFRCEELVIEDDGLIYNGEDQYKTFRQAIGKIDYASGFIYGEDYVSSWAIPIGKIKQNGNVTEVYGDDYTKLMAQPIYYIRDNRIYAADEFYKMFPSEAAYISGDLNGNGGNTSGSKSHGSSGSGGSSVSDGTSGGGGDSSSSSMSGGGFWGLMKLIFGGILVVAAFVIPFKILSGEYGSEEGAMLATALCVGAVIAIVWGQDKFTSMFLMFVGSLIAIFILDIIFTYKNGNLEQGEILFALIFGVFIYGLVLIVPSILGGFIIGFIKELFTKKKKKEEASENE